MTYPRSLAGAFTHVAFKTLTAVEADATRSNQHEFNASSALREMFGASQPQRLSTDFVWMPDDGDYFSWSGELTWYDARARHPTRSEYRLYYRDNPVSAKASEGDLVVIARRSDGRLLLLLAPGGGPASDRIAGLFGMESRPGARFAALGSLPGSRPSLPDGIFGEPVSGDVDGWEAESQLTASAGDHRVRINAASSQDRVARVASEALPSWEEADAEDVALKSTIEGLLWPRRGR